MPLYKFVDDSRIPRERFYTHEGHADLYRIYEHDYYKSISTFSISPLISTRGVQ
jgi:hypothetical protein